MKTHKDGSSSLSRLSFIWWIDCRCQVPSILIVIMCPFPHFPRRLSFPFVSLFPNEHILAYLSIYTHTYIRILRVATKAADTWWFIASGTRVPADRNECANEIRPSPSTLQTKEVFASWPFRRRARIHVSSRRSTLQVQKSVVSTDGMDLGRRGSFNAGRRCSFQQQEVVESSKSKTNLRNFYIFFVALFLFIFVAVVYSFIRMVKNQTN